MERSERTSTPAYKRCSGCGEVKSSNEFWKNKCSSDGLQTWCILCKMRHNRKAADNRYNRSHMPERVASNRRRYHEIQDEAGCHSKPRDFAPGFIFIKALEKAEVVNV